MIDIIAQHTHSYGASIERLVNILDRFQGSNDSLSNNLFNWGVKVLRVTSDYRSNSYSQETITRLFHQYIHELTHEILVSPLDGQPLRIPLIERDWVWERSVHLECKNLFASISPLDGLGMEETPLPHLFAQEMLEWMGGPRLFARSSVSRENPNALWSQDARMGEARHFIYQRLAKAAIQIRQQQRLRDEMDAVLIHTRTQLSTISQMDLQVMERDQARVVQHEEELRVRLAALQQAHDRTIEEINIQVAFMESSHKSNIAILEGQIAAIDQANSVIADSLRNQVTLMHQEHQKTVTAFRGQIDSLNDSHKRLETRLVSETRAHQEAMSSVTQSMRHLETRVSEGFAKAATLQSQLHIAQTQNRERAAEIQHLRNANISARAQIDALQDELDDIDGGFCSIM